MSVNVMNGLHDKCQSVKTKHLSWSVRQSRPFFVVVTLLYLSQSWLTYQAPVFWTASNVLIWVC